MKVEIISIGDEILIGRTINTNAAWIGEQLSLLGFFINRVTTISDTEEAITQSIKQAYTENNVVIITGGLGPTNDDITKLILCKLFDSPLSTHSEALKNIKKFVSSRGGEMNQLNKDQALFPEKADFIPNYSGTASGMWFSHENCIIISLPGVPHEMKDMMSDTIIPKLRKEFTLPVIVHEHILLSGIAEAKLAEIIAPWEDSLSDKIKLAYLPSPGIIKLRLTCITDSHEQAEKLISQAISDLKPYVQDHIYGYGLKNMEEIVGDMLRENEATISTAESCTGGNIAHILTLISGSSQYFKGGIVSYDNSIKINELHVPESTITSHGAVSKEVVEIMAQECRKKFNTTYAISTSGIAGPTGGTEKKRVGTVWIGIADSTNTYSYTFNFGNNRERVITRTSITALNLIRKLLINNKL
ncbi:MAG: competence/damage-inducible protein A [Bacteroidales bacterium]|jgi:nicotinamide-nucleotide amidase|nr:competence/damage-inducible protein A [Bacteroidales bacterium]